MHRDEQFIDILRQAVQKKFGRDISGLPACAALSEQMKMQGIVLNPQTLRRFFNLISYEGGFSSFTLDSLALYGGYESFSALRRSVTENELEIFFDDAGQEFKHSDLWKASEVLSKKISESPGMLSTTHHRLMKFPHARKFFIEHHPMRDLCCTVYAQYFHEYLKFNNSNEAKLFAYGFLFMGSFLSENEEFMEIYHAKICDTPLTPEVYVLPAARKFGVKLLYAWKTGKTAEYEKIYSEMLAARKTYIKASRKSVCSFEYTVLEHLIYTDRYEDMKFLIENRILQKFKDLEFVTPDRKESHDEVWKILCAHAFHKMGERENAQKYLQQTETRKLAVGWKKYYSIMYYFTKLEYVTATEKPEILRKLSKLIADTHFSYYQPQLAELTEKSGIEKVTA